MKSKNQTTTYQRRSLRNNGTAAEAVLWKYLKNSQVNGYKFRRQQGIGPYVMDFFCPLLQLAIELDGGIHSQGGQYEHDAVRDAFIKQQGIAILRFPNEVVWSNVDGILEEIVAFGRVKLNKNHPSV